MPAPPAKSLLKQRVRTAVRGLVGGVILLTLVANLYIRFHYAASMPRSPQPQTGRIHPVPAQYGGIVYVNAKEYNTRNFIEQTLTSISSTMLLVFIGTELALGGWPVRTKKPT